LDERWKLRRRYRDDGLLPEDLLVAKPYIKARSDNPKKDNPENLGRC
jgi:hypothetical protein